MCLFVTNLMKVLKESKQTNKQKCKKKPKHSTHKNSTNKQKTPKKLKQKKKQGDQCDETMNQHIYGRGSYS